MNRINRRVGIATMEFIFVFPVLLALVAGIFLMARAAVQKTATVTAARSDAWEKRTSSSNGEVLAVRHEVMKSRATGTANSAVQRSPLFALDAFTANSRTIAIGRSWDGTGISFGRKPRLDPHIDLLGQMTGGLPGGKGVQKIIDTLGPLVGQSFRALNPEENKLIQLASDLGEVSNKIVEVSGALLGGIQSVVGPFFDSVEDFIEANTFIVEGISFIIPKAKEAVNTIKNIVKIIKNAFDFGLNLFEASRGRPGAWIGNALVSTFNSVKSLGNSLPKPK